MSASLFSDEELKVITNMEDIKQQVVHQWRLEKYGEEELIAALKVIEKYVVYHFLQNKYPEQFYGTYRGPEYSVGDRYMDHAGYNPK